MRICGNHNKTLQLIAVAQLVINAGWRIYTLSAGPGLFRLTLLSLCTFVNEVQGVKVHLEGPLTHVELKQGSGGRGCTKALTMSQENGAVHLYFLKLSPRPSPEPCWPLLKLF